jgi:Zn-dependent peptidase ImmA (M78 family)/transcriptional regulator with XRE-family HTH domain
LLLSCHVVSPTTETVSRGTKEFAPLPRLCYIITNLNTSQCNSGRRKASHDEEDEVSAVAGLGARLRQAREWAGFSQQDVAGEIGVAREVLSYWENEHRTPGFGQLHSLAEVLGVPVAHLLGDELAPGPNQDHAFLYRDLDPRPIRTRAGVGRWLAFLEEWADLREVCGDALPGRSAPANPDWRAPEAITDSRRAPTLAAEARAYYRLGSDAVPDLAAFLDQQGVLVYRAWLDRLEEGGVSGAFYNHPRLGYCVLVNANTTPGRQAFTLAHEFAHALFHYQERGLISRAGDPDRKERLADEFAAHFLVPGDKLRDLVGRHGDRVVSPFEVIRLQRYFRVSYATMLVRLRGTGLLSPEQYEEYRRYSPSDLASRLGLDGDEYRPPTDPRGVTLAAYPASVLERIQALVRDGDLGLASAASLLNVSQEEVTEELLAAPKPAKAEEAREFAELPQPAVPRTRRKDLAVR